MKKAKAIIRLSIASVIAIVFLWIPAQAEDEKPSFGMDFTWNSAYVWRGILLVDSFVFNPSATVGYKGVSLNVWGSMESSSDNDGIAPGDFHEIDYTVDFSHSFGKVGLSTGVVNYTFPNPPTLLVTATTISLLHPPEPTSEWYGGAALDVLLSPSFTVYYDIDLIHGLYFNGAIAQSFNLFKPADSTQIGLDLGASLGYGDSKHNEAYYGVNDPAFTDVLLSLGIPVSVGDFMAITPSGYYAVLVDNDIRDMSDDDVNWFYGVSVGISL